MKTKTRLTTPLTPELYCKDIKVSLHFYTQILGFKIQYQREEAGFAMLERQGACIMLDQIVRGSVRTWVVAPLEAPFGRGINLQIETDRVDELYEGVQKHGAQIFLPMEEKWYRCDDIYLGNRQFIVQDPDGYLLRFFQDLGSRRDLIHHN
jgi:catechol 2,3-dioxygenase-like lactoylglutathione lyase family enzyme